MEGSTVSAVTELLVNILIGTFSLATLTWVFVGIQTFINDRRNESVRLNAKSAMPNTMRNA